MSVTSENNKRIAKNTLFLYLRMLLIMGVTLYTSRVVLRVLGVEDFGIYSAVGGFVSMFAVISGSLTAAISRFITYEMGVGNTEKIARIFSVSVVIHLYKLFSSVWHIGDSIFIRLFSMGSIGILCILNGALGFFRTFSLYVLL